MGRDHKLYYEAYNDASDLNADGVIDTRYKPAIDYFGYFDSNKCYTYINQYSLQPGSSSQQQDLLSSGAEIFSLSDDFAYGCAAQGVFYGGNRSTDTATETVLQRAYIPQDAHSRGKEYTSVAIDGYDISDYAPLSLPATNTRHFFANTTLSDNGDPLLRVLTNTPFRIWEWVSIQRPVAGTDLRPGTMYVHPVLVCTGSDTWQIVPSSAFSGLTQTTYDMSGAYIPNDHTEGTRI